MGRARAISWALTLLALAWAGLMAAHHRSLWLDDAFISFRYALNLRLGRGFVFNAGEAVEGITNLGWTLALVPFAERDPLAAARALGLAATAGSVLLLARWLRREGLSLPAQALALAVMVVPPWLPFAAVQGLETSAVMFMVTLGWTRYREEAEGGGWPLAALGLALAPWLRPDAVMAPALVGLWHLARRGPVDSPAARRTAGLVLASGVALVALKLAWFGALLPNTFHVKAGEWPPKGGYRYLSVFLSAPSPAFGGLTLAGLALGLRRALQRDDRALPGLLFLCWLAMSVAVNGDFFSNFRLLVPAWPALAAALALAVDALPVRWPQALGAALAGLTLAPYLQLAEISKIPVIPGSADQGPLLRGYGAPLFMPWRAPDWTQGLRPQWVWPTSWLATHARPGESLALTDIGLVSYLNDDKPIVDMIGLTDPEIAASIGQPSVARYRLLEAKADRLLFDTNMNIWRELRALIEEGEWALEASCGPLWILRNPDHDDKIEALEPSEALTRARLALTRTPGMVGLHLALARQLAQRGASAETLEAFIRDAQASAPEGTAPQYAGLRCELGLDPACASSPPMCISTVEARSPAEVAAEAGWPWVVGQAVDPGEDRVVGCQARHDQAQARWATLTPRLGDPALEAQARRLQQQPAERALAAIRAARELAGVVPASHPARAEVEAALAASEQAWETCRGGRPGDGRGRQRD